MTHCDPSVKSARDEMIHIIGSSGPVSSLLPGEKFALPTITLTFSQSTSKHDILEPFRQGFGLLTA